MNETTSYISDLLDRTSISFMMLKTRMTMGPNNPLLQPMLNMTHENLSALIQETSPEWFTEEEEEYITEMSEFIFEMSETPEWEHLFCEEETDND